MNQKFPLFSVVVLTYNQERFVTETLDSIYAQDYPNIELIVSDDASTDNTVPLIKRWIENHKNKFVNSKLLVSDTNYGISYNHTKGCKEAKGEFLKYISGDDILLPESLSKMVNFLIENRDINICVSRVQQFFDNEHERTYIDLSIIPEIKYDKFFGFDNIKQFKMIALSNFLPAPGFYFRRTVLEKYGFFGTKFRYLEDVHTWFKCLLGGEKIYLADFLSIKQRIHNTSVSRSALIYSGNIGFAKDKLEISKTYLIPNIKMFSVLERIHIYSDIKYLNEYIKLGGGIKAHKKAIRAYVGDILSLKFHILSFIRKIKSKK